MTFEKPKPKDVVQGGEDRTCTVSEFSTMTPAERQKFTYKGKSDNE